MPFCSVSQAACCCRDCGPNANELKNLRNVFGLQNGNNNSSSSRNKKKNRNNNKKKRRRQMKKKKTN